MRKLASILTLSILILWMGRLDAQFGQNTVQYDRYDWHFIQSPYFDIYFYGDDLTLAEYTSEVATDAYLHISDRLNWQIQKRISIMVYQSHSDFQQTNVISQYLTEGIGGVTELFKNRVVVPFEGSYEAFEHVIYHELVHAVINDLIYGGNIQSIVSGRIRYSIPLWMNEGLAEYLSSGWNAQSDMYMRDLALHGDIPPIPQLGGLYAYRGGQSVWRYITGKYGEESIAEIFAQIRSKSNVERGLKRAIGADYELLSEQWKEHLKKQYWPDVAGRDRLKDIAHPVTDHEKLDNVYNIAPSISPDGSKLALMRNNHGNMEIILISATDGRFLKRLIRGGTTAEFEELHLLKPGITWSPDGKRVAFAAKSANEDILYVVDIKNGKVKKYSSGLEGIFMATWSPDGGTIAFIGNNGTSSDIYLLNIETELVTNLTDDVFGEFNPVWSPDGMALAFSSDRGDLPPYRYDQESNPYNFDQRFDPVTGAPLSSVKPDFKLFEHDFDQKDIFSIDRDGSNLRRITTDPAAENYPVYAHGEPYLYYTSQRSGIDNIYMVNLETGEERAVTNILTGISDLNMSSDDTRLYFTGFERSGFDVYRIHNPIGLWDEPKEIEPSNYILADTTTLEQELVNVDRDRRHTVGLGNYDRYIFGVDKPYAYTSHVADSIDLVVLDEANIKDEKGNYRVHPYKTRFTLDLVQSYAGYSTLYSFQGMTQFIFSDMLGNHRISLATEMQISLQNSDYFLTYHLLPFRINYYFTLFHTAYLYYSGSSIFGQELNRLRHYGLDITASLPMNRFHRFDFSITTNTVELAKFNDQNFNQSFVQGETTRLPTVIPRLGHVWDNAEWGYLHPVNGWRTNFGISGSPKLWKQGIEFQTLAFDVRRYFRLPGETSLAARVSGGASFGRDAQNFLVGGLPWVFSSEGSQRYKNDAIFRDFDDQELLKTLYFSEYLTPLRGTQLMELVGDRALLMNLEFRFPFLIYYFPALGMLGQLSGVLFVDAGTVWDANGTDTVGSGPSQQSILTYGWGPRFILFGLPIQLDYAWQYKPPPGEGGRNWYLTIGFDF
ncbi:MAG: PD40 domain-containing protein [Candidatus Marinimicrobia bacterium]|nr:PD40 domain-containing protein [Candidatus Neomarinimicrobiota bacterium]